MRRLFRLTASAIRATWLIVVGWWLALVLIALVLWLARLGHGVASTGMYGWLPTAMHLGRPWTNPTVPPRLYAVDAGLNAVATTWAASIRRLRLWDGASAEASAVGAPAGSGADDRARRKEAKYWRTEFTRALRTGVTKGHFECQTCGRWADTESSGNEWGVAIRSRIGVTRSEWELIRRQMTRGPVRIAHIQRALNRSYEDAVTILAAATSLQILVPEGDGYLLGPGVCGTCLRSRSIPTSRIDGAVIRGEREPIGARLRFLILQRDGFRCTYCGRSQQDGAILHVDHVVPVAAGGATALENLVTACSNCNLGKSDGSVVPPSTH